MTLVMASLVFLVAGAVASLALLRAAPWAIGVSLSLAFVSSILALIAGVAFLLRGAAPVTYESAWPLIIGAFSLSLDGLSAWFLMTIGVLGAPVAVYSAAYLRTGMERGRLPFFGALFCGLLVCLILLVCASDAVLFLIAWEGMTLCAFLLVSLHHERGDVRRGAWMYLVATHLGTALFVVALFGVLCAGAGSTAFSSFPQAFCAADSTALTTLFFLGLMGFGTKAGVMPMHVWLPAAHSVAPAPVSAMLSGVVVKTGVYGLLRLFSWLPPLPIACGETLLLVGVVSGVMGVLYALAQHDLKRLLAYHTVENIGIITVGMGVGLVGAAMGEPALAAVGYAGAMLHVTNHALFKGLLFLSAGAVQLSARTGELNRLGGLIRRMPANAVLFMLGAVAICGLPPLNGFLSEWFVYGSLLQGAMCGTGAISGLAAVGAAGLAMMGGLALACFAKVFGGVFLGTPRETLVPSRPVGIGMTAPMAALALCCILIGVLPELWTALVGPALVELTRTPAGDIRAHLRALLPPASRLSAMFVLLFVLVGGLLVVRNARRLRLPVGVSPTAGNLATWACGYSRSTPRMQTTPSSFAAPLVMTLRTLLWPAQVVVKPVGAFPAASRWETHVSDVAERDLFAPLFRAVSRLFAMVRTVSPTGEIRRSALRAGPAARSRGPLRTAIDGTVAALQRGSIQMRLLFLVLTLVLVFLFEAKSMAHRAAAPSVKGASDNVGVFE